ncbi:MAG: hypothetical protein Q4C64_00565 [Erysipelotrichia bacterium]|nr:hypothetical protein [Erysipelotrichia bacterium]
MRKSLSIILIIVFSLFVSVCPVKAQNTDKSGYYYTQDDAKCDEYVFDDLWRYLNSIENINLNDITVGSGIKVFSDMEQVEKIIYPIYENDKLKYTFMVLNTGEGYGGFLSEWYVDNLSYLLSQSSSNEPLLLFENRNEIFGQIGNKKMQLTVEEKVMSIVERIELESNVEINSQNSYVEFNKTSTKSMNQTVRLKWHSDMTQDEDEYDCGIITMHNILYNQFGGIYWYNDIATYMTNKYGDIYHINTYRMYQYLVNSSLSAYNYMPSSRPTLENVKYYIGSLSKYIYACGSRPIEDGKRAGHAFAIIGYNDNDLVIYIDPYIDYSMTSSPNYYTLPCYYGGTFTWDEGYITNIYD